MAVLHDLICSACEEVVVDASSTGIGTFCRCGNGTLEIFYGNWGKRKATPFDPALRTVVYEHPGTKKIIYPGRNDAEMPERYRVQGYERIELKSLSEVDRFSKKHGLVNEAAHYNRGNSYDHERGRR